LSVTRSVLTGGKSVDKTAAGFWCELALEKRFWGLLFRKCLDVLAKALGFSNSAQRPRRVRLNGDGGIPDTADATMHADAGDLADARLRSARPTGGDHGH
jgi:hypothetical protein